MYATTLLVLHVLGAVVGFGPTFAFGILGNLSSKNPGPGALALMKGISSIERILVIPVATIVQPVTGALLIWARGWDESFFSHDWLFGGIVLYVIAFVLAVAVQNPALHRMIELAEETQGPPTEEFQKLASRSAKIGPVLGILIVVIVVLMVAKPGS